MPLDIAHRLAFEQAVTAERPDMPFRDIAADSKYLTIGRFDRVSHRELYDPLSLRGAYAQALPKEIQGYQETDDTRHSIIVVTGRGIAKREPRGLHLRGGISLGAVALVSTTGLVEAPGKPIEVDDALRSGFLLHSGDPQRLNRFNEELAARGNVLNGDILNAILHIVYEDKMLAPEDPRLTEAAKGMTLSMILFTLGEHGKVSQCSTTDLAQGEPDVSKTCRLHDAHWQEELLASQLKRPEEQEFCPLHTTLFSLLKRT